MPAQRATTAQEWVDDLNEMLVTYGDEAAIVAFAQERAAIAGAFVAVAEPFHIAAERAGWDAVFDTCAGRWHVRAV